VLDLVQAEDEGARAKADAVKEIRHVPDRPADLQRDDPPSHQGIVRVDPERQALRSRREGRARRRGTVEKDHRLEPVFNHHTPPQPR